MNPKITKTFEIENCSECPYYIFDEQTTPKRWSHHWCLHKNGDFKVKEKDIPKKCPLGNGINKYSDANNIAVLEEQNESKVSQV